MIEQYNKYNSTHNVSVSDKTFFKLTIIMSFLILCKFHFHQNTFVTFLNNFFIAKS